MHKRLKLDNTGGAPVGVQEAVDFLQTAIKEAVCAPYSNIVNKPVILTGMEVSGSAVAAGWFYYNGNLYQYAGGSFPTLQPGEETAMVIGETFVQKEYADGVLKDFMGMRVAALGAVATPAGNLAFTNFIRWNETYKDAAFTSAAWSSTGSATGTLYYRKNKLTNTLQLKGAITVAAPAGLHDPAWFYSGGITLPAGYRPAITSYFKAFIRYHDTAYILETAGTEHVVDVTGEITTAGAINIGFIKPDAAVTTYTVNINCIIPLD